MARSGDTLRVGGIKTKFCYRSMRNVSFHAALTRSQTLAMESVLWCVNSSIFPTRALTEAASSTIIEEIQTTQKSGLEYSRYSSMTSVTVKRKTYVGNSHLCESIFVVNPISTMVSFSNSTQNTHVVLNMPATANLSTVQRTWRNSLPGQECCRQRDEETRFPTTTSGKTSLRSHTVFFLTYWPDLCS